MKLSEEVAVARTIGAELRTMTRITGRGDDDEVLIDIPRRPLDIGGKVYVRFPEDVLPIEERSDPIRAIMMADYDRLTKNIRIFGSPELIGGMQEKWGDLHSVNVQSRIHDIISRVLADVGTTQVE